MSHIKNITRHMRGGALVLSLLCLLGASSPAARGATPAGLPVAKSVRAATSGASTLITISGTAPMPYSVRRPEARLLVVELPGVDATQLAPAYDIASPLVAGVEVRRTLRGTEPVASLQIALRAPVRERSHLAGNELVLELQPETAASTPAAAQSRPTPTPTPDAQGPSQPPTQGQQYGQPGFIGEPINLNVVNADIRDILNYITEQYGVNFVVDSSVRQVPVTINVTEVPWNFALDSLLKANRLGIEVNGNILRIATLEVLKDEAKIRAEEAAAQSRLREAQLENTPLVTEFIRLNYARASGSLASAAGGSDAFTGGGSAGGGSGGGSGIMPIIARRLSRRGGIEVDDRSNTLIVTDVRENIDAIRRLVQLLDQPEPQVEIETRIVVASRNFSRDLGVQLSASVLNPSRGTFGSFGTQNGINLTNGTNSLTIPAPSGSLGAAGPNTVIGLTTGIFGTAQISALITAAEAKGQAKVIATPRVTALNNRSAQIESGSQIPVVTPQIGAGGGSSLFTTTFVSVPLRLSVTPQITDAGTVIMRVTMENNTVNTTVNSLGTPGIDTQRMQTEVLVPDGGTTVVGGVMTDRETDVNNRTPGLASIPVVGNLFKRKLITRNTDEILFFITPRIYRPDYQGRRIETDPATGTRSVTIPQPVPLGNPGTNTPTPSMPQQQPQVPANNAAPATTVPAGTDATPAAPTSRP
ncbi:MAG TPA: type IV pilus secretin PilQ [Pyrinomonadaceae bacterium]|jgi:type IV pilus assembly protein PilQ|nr:type IV pilus secretin PilQ [Pyrinomonadaceae bacterium]